MVPDPDWRLCDVFSIEDMPTIIVVDQQGRVLFTEAGVYENPIVYLSNSRRA
jgi:tartrate dehydratase beta subunit/fumarate hydratase class I family protein